LVALVFSVIEAPAYGWLRTIAGLALAVVLLVRFVVWELRQATPLLDPRVFRKAAVGRQHVDLRADLRLLRLHVHRHAVPPAGSRRHAAARRRPDSSAAAAMVPTSRLVPQLTARYGTRTVCASGLSLVGAGLIVIAQAGTHTPYALMAAGPVLLGVGPRGRRRNRDRGDRKHPHLHLRQ
jgi:hypothetical protein